MSFEIIYGLLIIKTGAIVTVAVSALLLLLGYHVKSKLGFLVKYCIPAPVVGGFIFMFATYFGYKTGRFSIDFDTYFQAPFMLAFFTTVGLGASFKLLKKGGALLIVYWLVAGAVSICQNIIGVVVGKLIGLPAPYALLSSAVSMIGGHGAAGVYGSTFVEMGYPSASLVGMGAATFGLISAVIIGGPVGQRLIVKHNLKADENEDFNSETGCADATSEKRLSTIDIMKNVAAILVCMAAGVLISGWIGNTVGTSFPSYVGAMFAAVVLRNLNEGMHLYKFDFVLVDGIGYVMLSLYLSIALMTLKLWELEGLVGGVLAVLLCQVLFMIAASYFIVFRVLGSNYDAAVMCAGLCGHGLGATPSAIVNMTAVNERYGMSRRAMMIVPIVGAFLVDIIYQPQTIWFIKTFVEGFNK
ncbi:MAG: sodium/glutamate symporter [Cloacibacillus sp.]